MTRARLAYSYDEGGTWTETLTARQDDGTWTAKVDHSGATGKQVTLKTVLTDTNGTSVTQIVTRAYDVR